MARKAELHRMVTPDHVCPWGLKSKHLLESHGFEVEDYELKTRQETDAFMARHGVKSTPQTFIKGERIGGYEELRTWFGNPVPDKDAVSYQPVIAIFAIAFLMALSLGYALPEGPVSLRTLEWFISISMCILAIQKLQDVDAFSTMFLNYDLLAQHWVPYGRVYPFGEALAGILMVGGLLPWISAPVALFIGTVGAVSVVKAVYIDRRELKCACVGGSSRVPLGFVSLTENLMMMAMGLWTFARMLA